MSFRSGQRIGRLSQLKVPCLSARRFEPSMLQSKRVSASFSTLLRCLTACSPISSSYTAPAGFRGYADRPVSRPKAHTGRTTTAPRKKAASGISSPSAKKTLGPRRSVASTKAKPKPKPKPRSASKLKAKSKPAVKRKATRKAKPNAKPKKVLTAEEKEKLRATRSAKQERLKVKSLKKAALKPPTVRSSSWLVFLKDKTSENKSEGKVPISEVTKRAAVEYKKLTPERLEHYNHVANQEKAASAAAYRKWIESYTPEEIRLANNARRNLARRGVGPHFPLKDERLVKTARSPYLLFSVERFATGDFKGIKLPEAASLIAREYKALSTTDKQKYKDLAAQDHQRYVQESKAVYNRDITPLPSTPAVTAAAAAA